MDYVRNRVEIQKDMRALKNMLLRVILRPLRQYDDWDDYDEALLNGEFRRVGAPIDIENLKDMMCNGELFDKNPAQALDFFDQLAKILQWFHS